MDFFKIIFLAALINNVVLSQFIGVRPLLAQSNGLSTVLRMSLITLVSLLIVNIASYFISKYILNPLQIQFLQTLIYIFIIISVFSLLKFFARKRSQKIIQKIVTDIPAITVNSVVLGICLLAFNNFEAVGLNYIIVFTIASVAGYILLLAIMAGIAEQTRLTVVPKGMKGIPISLITLGILALAFMGLTGIFK